MHLNELNSKCLTGLTDAKSTTVKDKIAHETSATILSIYCLLSGGCRLCASEFDELQTGRLSNLIVKGGNIGSLVSSSDVYDEVPDLTIKVCLATGTCQLRNEREEFS